MGRGMLVSETLVTRTLSLTGEDSSHLPFIQCFHSQLNLEGPSLPPPP